MNFKRVCKSALCLLVACFLVFNIVSIPARATGLGAIATIEAIGTALGPVGTVAAASVIALGLYAGANPDDFDAIVDGVSSAMTEIGTNMKDGFVQMLQVTDSQGYKQLYVAADWLENVRSYLFDSGSLSSNYATRDIYSGVAVDGRYYWGTDLTVFKVWYDRGSSGSTQWYGYQTLIYNRGSQLYYSLGIDGSLKSSGSSAYTYNGDTYYLSDTYSDKSCTTSEWPSVKAQLISEGYSQVASRLSWSVETLGSSAPRLNLYGSSLDVSIGKVSSSSIVDDVSVYDTAWNANQIRVATANPDGSDPEYKVYFPLSLPSTYEDLHTVTQSDILSGSVLGTPDIDDDEKFKIEELPLIDGYQGVLVSPPTSGSESGTGAGTGTGAGVITLPGWVQDGFNNLKNGLTDILNSLKNLPSALWALIPAWIQEGLSNMVVGLRDILDAIKALPGAIADSIAEVLTNALTKAFAISDSFVATKVEALTMKYPYLDTFLALGVDLKSFFLGLGTTPPVIYINLGASEGSYNIGGQEVFMDLSWYARYKPTMDAVLGAFIWLWLAWRVYLAIPGIISGASGVWGSYNVQHERNLRAEERDQRQQFYASRRKKE